MKTKPLSYQSGSTLVVALLICLAGSMGLMSLVTLVANRGQYVEDSRTAIQRRIALQNGKAHVRTYLYGGPIVSQTSLEATSLPDLGEWGGIASIGAITTPPLESYQELSYYNRTSPSNGEGFTVDVPVSLTIPTKSGDVTYEYDYQLRSSSPLLSGYPFVLHQPVINPGASANVSGNVIVEGHSVIHHQNLKPPLDLVTETYDALPLMEVEEEQGGSGSGLGLGLGNGPGLGLGLDNGNGPGGIIGGILDPILDLIDSILGIEALSNLVGELQPPRNYVSITNVTGLLGDSPAVGKFTAMFNPESPSNALISKLESIGGAIQVYGNQAMSLSGVTVEDPTGPNSGNVVIDLKQHTLSQVHIHNEVKSLRIIGNNTPEADGLPLVFIVYHKSDNVAESHRLTEIILDGNNNRRVIFGGRRVGSNDPINLVSQANRWRMLLTLENLPLLVNPMAGSELVLVGGVRTESSVRTQSGTRLRIVPEDNPGLLERLDTREAWIESHAK